MTQKAPLKVIDPHPAFETAIRQPARATWHYYYYHYYYLSHLNKGTVRHFVPSLDAALRHIIIVIHTYSFSIVLFVLEERPISYSYSVAVLLLLLLLLVSPSFHQRLTNGQRDRLTSSKSAISLWGSTVPRAWALF